MGTNFTDIATTDPVNAATLNDRLDELDTALGTVAGLVGEVRMWTTDTAPSNWLLCYGQAVSRTTYSALYAVIGGTFGIGDGSTTFNLPDMRGRMPLGQDDMGGASANRVTDAAADGIAGVGGAETHTLVSGEMPSHNHTSVNVLDGSALGSGDTAYDIMTESGAARSDVVTSSTGGGGAHANMPPWMALNFIIYAGA